MEEKKYIDMDGMQDRVDAAHKAHLTKISDEIKKQSENVEKRNDEVRALFGKVLQQEVDEEERKVIAEMEAEKTRAINEIEERYGRKSAEMHTAKHKDEDADLKEMLRNLNSR